MKLNTTQRNLLIWEQAERPDYKVGIKDLLDIAQSGAGEQTVHASAKFLKLQLPPMLAKRVKDLQALPRPFQRTGGSIADIARDYEETFLQVLHAQDPVSAASEAEFCHLIRSLKEKDEKTGEVIYAALKNIRCLGTGEWVDPHGNLMYFDDPGKSKVQDVFQRFYTGRIGIRLLIDQHLMLREDVISSSSSSSLLPVAHSQSRAEDLQRRIWRTLKKSMKQGRPGDRHNEQELFYGVLHPRCKAATVLKMAVEDAMIACRGDISDACGKHITEEIEVVYAGDLDISVPFVPEHLYIIACEIVANAIRVTAERHGPKLGWKKTFPPIKIIISASTSHLYIKFSDQGGGVPHEDEAKVWKFSYSPRRSWWHHNAQDLTMSSAGRQGLPLSQLYARYWGGDITMMNVEGWGCDFLLRIPLRQEHGALLVLPAHHHDDPLQRGKCAKEYASYPFAFGDQVSNLYERFRRSSHLDH